MHVAFLAFTYRARDSHFCPHSLFHDIVRKGGSPLCCSILQVLCLLTAKHFYKTTSCNWIHFQWNFMLSGSLCLPPVSRSMMSEECIHTTSSYKTLGGIEILKVFYWVQLVQWSVYDCGLCWDGPHEQGLLGHVGFKQGNEWRSDCSVL